MQESGIPVPHHICVNRDNLPPDTDPPGFIETEDYVEQDGEHDPKCSALELVLMLPSNS